MDHGMRMNSQDSGHSGTERLRGEPCECPAALVVCVCGALLALLVEAAAYGLYYTHILQCNPRPLARSLH